VANTPCEDSTPYQKEFRDKVTTFKEVEKDVWKFVVY